MKFQRLKKRMKHAEKKITIFLTEFGQFGMQLALYKYGERNSESFRIHRIPESFSEKKKAKQVILIKAFAA